jgi:hypothetical protein
MALLLFAAAGVGIAICVATSPQLEASRKARPKRETIRLESAEQREAPPAPAVEIVLPVAKPVACPDPAPREAAPVEAPRVVPPRAEFAQQFPTQQTRGPDASQFPISVPGLSSPTATAGGAPSQADSMSQLGELGKLLMEQLKAENGAQAPTPPKAYPPDRPAADPGMSREDEEAELFRGMKGSQTRNEIIVLISPHIVYEPESGIEGDKAACEFHRHQSVYCNQLTPWNSRYLGHKFFRFAQNAWAAGDKTTAMRFINLAIHFDPQNRASINLRSDIVAGNHVGDHTGTLPLAAPVSDPTEVFDGAAIAPWVLDDLEHEGPRPPLHPRDPGQPGRAVSIEHVGEFR